MPIAVCQDFALMDLAFIVCVESQGVVIDVDAGAKIDTNLGGTSSRLKGVAAAIEHVHFLVGHWGPRAVFRWEGGYE